MSDIQLSPTETRTRESDITSESPSDVTANYFNYFTEIEDTFIRRRGKHLLLGPLDWALIEGWKDRGVPLHVALRGIETAFDSHARKANRRSVKSLMYCQEEVEAQYAEWLEGQRGASSFTEGESARGSEVSAREPTLPFPRELIAAHLLDCREQLARTLVQRSKSGTAGEFEETLTRATSRLKELEDDFNSAARPDGHALEDALTALEVLLDRAIVATCDPSVVDARRRLAAEQLKPYRSRMERGTYDQTLENLVAKALREACGVPRLSLFYL